MDFGFKHISPLPRHFPHPFKVLSIGRIAQKKQRIQHSFETLNFSFILCGSGDFLIDGKAHRIDAPCVFIQPPRKFVSYGPSSGSHWDELYIIYEASCLRPMIKSGWLSGLSPVWTVSNPDTLTTLIEQLQELLANLEVSGNADRVDRICECMIMESRLGRVSKSKDPAAEPTARAVSMIRRNWNRPIDWQELAKSLGMSESSLRRAWQQSRSDTPGAYQQTLRLREARRLLAETLLTAAEIARQCGYEDPLYFSRIFHKKLNTTVRDYRRLYQEKSLKRKRG